MPPAQPINLYCVPAGAEPASHVQPSQRIRLRPLQEAAQAAASQTAQWQHPVEQSQILGIGSNDSSPGATALTATSSLQPLLSRRDRSDLTNARRDALQQGAGSQQQGLGSGPPTPQAAAVLQAAAGDADPIVSPSPAPRRSHSEAGRDSPAASAELSEPSEPSQSRSISQDILELGSHQAPAAPAPGLAALPGTSMAPSAAQGLVADPEGLAATPEQVAAGTAPLGAEDLAATPTGLAARPGVDTGGAAPLKKVSASKEAGDAGLLAAEKSAVKKRLRLAEPRTGQLPPATVAVEVQRTDRLAPAPYLLGPCVVVHAVQAATGRPVAPRQRAEQQTAEAALPASPAAAPGGQASAAWQGCRGVAGLQTGAASMVSDAFGVAAEWREEVHLDLELGQLVEQDALLLFEVQHQALRFCVTF